jgi:hypothetical protein
MRQAFAVLLLVLFAATRPAHGQDELQKLQQQLLQRDALIQELLRRVEALEQTVRGPASPAPAPATTAQASPVARAPAAEPAAEDEGLRALERALVREGGLVLPPRAVELEPRYQFSYDGRRGLAIVQTPAGPQVTEGTTRQQRHEATLGLRVGLPSAWQVSLRLPYVEARDSSAASAVGVDQARHRGGIGDAEVQLTKQFSDERPGRPALLGSLAWKAANGAYQPGLPSPGSGFASLQAALTAVKRQDPLVFFGGLSYTAFRARSHGGNEIDPGDTVGVRLGTLLAASPQSSLRIGLDLARSSRTRVNGAAAAGTESLSGQIELGLSSLVSRRTSLDVSVGFGVTPEAPRLRVGLALPIRFH